MDDVTASTVINTTTRRVQAGIASGNPLYEAVVARLMNLQREYEADCAKVGQSRHDVYLKLRIMNKVDREYRERRAPYLLQLSLLEEKLLVDEQKAHVGFG